MYKFSNINQFTLIQPLTKPKYKQTVTIQFYKAINIESDKIYAIKKVEIVSQDKNNEDLKQLSNEINILTDLDHQNIVRFQALLQDDLFYYVVYQFIQKKLIKQKNNLSEKQVVIITHQLCDCLEYMHSHNIIHRDINITNIMFNGQDINIQIKLIDFQYAGRINNQNKRYTQYGSLDSISPQILLKKQQNKAVDIWGIGVILFQLLGKSQPFTNKQQDEQEFIKNTKNRIINRQFVNPKVKINEDAFDLIQKILKVDEQQRLTIAQIKAHRFIKKYPELFLFDVETFAMSANIQANLDAFDIPLNHQISQFTVIPKQLSVEQKYKQDLINKLKEYEQRLNELNDTKQPKQLSNLQLKVIKNEQYILKLQNQTIIQKQRLKNSEIQISKLQKQKKSLSQNRMNYEKSKLTINKFKKYLNTILQQNKKILSKIQKLSEDSIKNQLNFKSNNFITNKNIPQYSKSKSKQRQIQPTSVSQIILTSKNNI